VCGPVLKSSMLMILPLFSSHRTGRWPVLLKIGGAAGSAALRHLPGLRYLPGHSSESSAARLALR
jgi:hypothetical protein